VYGLVMILMLEGYVCLHSWMELFMCWVYIVPSIPEPKVFLVPQNPRFSAYQFYLCSRSTTVQF